MSTKLFVSVYLISTIFIFSLFSHLFVRIVLDIQSVQKLVSTEMVEFSYSSNEAWRLLSAMKSRRKRGIGGRYGKNQYYHEEADAGEAETYQTSSFPKPVGTIDGTSVGSVNGEEERISEKEIKMQRKEAKRKIASEMCLKDCQEKGKDCPAGPPGVPGKKGIDGEPGVPGADGPNGASGIAVAVAGGCIKCPTGKRGKRGKRGSTGKKGKNGKDGLSVKAVIGQAGPPGDGGYPGYPGFPGERGPRGPPGRDTNRYLNPPGPVGPPGREGYQGAQGAMGFVYNTALVGPIGWAGRDGVNGRNGATGATGRMGPPGRDGNYCECPPPSKRQHSPFKLLI